MSNFLSTLKIHVLGIAALWSRAKISNLNPTLTQICIHNCNVANAGKLAVEIVRYGYKTRK